MRVTGSVDVVVYECRSSSVKLKTLLQRPILTDRRGLPHVLFDGVGYPLYFSNVDSIVSFEKEKFLVHETQLQRLAPGASLVLPEEHGELNKILHALGFSWRTKVSQFGHLLEVTCGEDFIIDLVDEMLRSPVPVNVVDWGEVSLQRGSDAVSNWQVRVAQGISAKFLDHAVARMLGKLLAEFVNKTRVAENKARVGGDKILSQARLEAEAHKKTIQELQRQLEKKEKSVDSTSSSDKAVGASQAVKLKRNEAHRLIANAMYGAFGNLAFDPDSVTTILKRFVSSPDLWSTLSSLNNGDASLRLEALHGEAGKRAWREIRKHVSTGADNRGRIYVRKSKADFGFEVAVHWKQNEAEQNRFMKRLARLNSFGSRKVIFG